MCPFIFIRATCGRSPSGARQSESSVPRSLCTLTQFNSFQINTNLYRQTRYTAMATNLCPKPGSISAVQTFSQGSFGSQLPEKQVQSRSVTAVTGRNMWAALQLLVLWLLTCYFYPSVNLYSLKQLRHEEDTQSYWDKTNLLEKFICHGFFLRTEYTWCWMCVIFDIPIFRINQHFFIYRPLLYRYEVVVRNKQSCIGWPYLHFCLCLWGNHFNVLNWFTVKNYMINKSWQHMFFPLV